MFRILLPLALLSVVWACRTPDSSLLRDVPQRPDPGDSLFPDCRANACRHEVSSLEQFNSLAGRVDAGGVSQAIVKVVYRRMPTQSNGRLYFIDTQTYPFHYDFVRSGLGLNIRLQDFNDNYAGSGRDREFNQASLVHFPGEEGGLPAMMLLEMWSGDTLQAPYFIELYRKIKAKFGIDLPLVFHPLSAGQEELIPDLQAADIQTITTRELFRNKSYLALNQGEAIGYLRYIRGEPTACLDQTSIVVYDHVPNDIGLHAGVITSAFQTPLSHINVKSINRGTINMVLKNAHEVLAQYENKPVRIRATGEGYSIEEITAAEANAAITSFWDGKRPLNAAVPQWEESGEGFGQFSQMFSGLSSTRDIQRRHSSLTGRYGAKATNLGLIHRVLAPLQNGSQGEAIDVRSPDGYGMHFRFYDMFMNHRQAGIDPANPARVTTPQELLEETLARTNILDGSIFHSICQVKPALERIRSIVESADVPDEIIEEFRQLIIENEDSPIHLSRTARLRMRSSTNSEDLPGFSGAGLYNSAGTHFYDRDDDDRYLPDSPKTWDKIVNGGKGLKKRLAHLYSSVWNDRAFEEREWFRMNGPNHLRVKVAVALHRAFPKYDLRGAGELANGVSTSTNIYAEEEYDRIYINGQHYDLAVTNPPTNEELQEWDIDPTQRYVTEEMIVTPFVADPAEQGRPDAWKGWSYEVISRSSVKDGAPVLVDVPTERNDRSQTEVRRLAKVMDHLDRSFAPVYDFRPEDFAIDVEWKIFGDGRPLWIKQARPLHNASSDALDDGRIAPPSLIVAPERPLTPRGPRLQED